MNEINVGVEISVVGKSNWCRGWWVMVLCSGGSGRLETVVGEGLARITL